MEKDKEVNYCNDCVSMYVNIEHVSDFDLGTTTRRRCLAKPFNDHYANKSDKSRFMLCDDMRGQVGRNCVLFIDRNEEEKEVEPSICVHCGSFHNVGRKADGRYFVMYRQGCRVGVSEEFETREEAVANWEKRNVKEDDEEPMCVKCGNRHADHLYAWCETNRYYDGSVAIKRLSCLFCGETHLPGVAQAPKGYFVAATKKCRVNGPVKSSMVEAVKAWNAMHSARMDDRSAWIEERDGKKIAVFKAECEFPDDERNDEVFMLRDGSIKLAMVTDEPSIRDLCTLKIRNYPDMMVKINGK